MTGQTGPGLEDFSYNFRFTDVLADPETLPDGTVLTFWIVVDRADGGTSDPIEVDALVLEAIDPDPQSWGYTRPTPADCDTGSYSGRVFAYAPLFGAGGAVVSLTPAATGVGDKEYDEGDVDVYGGDRSNGVPIVERAATSHAVFENVRGGAVTVREIGQVVTGDDGLDAR